jgi:regulatory protein
MAGFKPRGFSGRRRKATTEPASPDAARERAIGLLARRDYSSKELQGRLSRAGFEASAAAAAVSDLEDERLVDDLRYLEHAVASRIERGQGPLRITFELKRLGLAAERVAHAVDARSAEWHARAVEVRQRRFGVAAPVDPQERTRQARFLLYRGFTSTQVRDALGRAAGDLADDELQDLDPSASFDEPDDALPGG